MVAGQGPLIEKSMIGDRLPASAVCLGESPIYEGADLPKRLRRWHSARVNRWELVVLNRGKLVIQSQQTDSVRIKQAPFDTSEPFVAEPGVRWRVEEASADAEFLIYIYAADKGRAATPLASRYAWLLEAPRKLLSSDQLDEISPLLAADGSWCIVDYQGDAAAIANALSRDPARYWYPLFVDGAKVAIVTARDESPVSLVRYLLLEHALIEAALGAVLAGHGEYEKYLRFVLGRHLFVEEEIIFRKYMDAGGDPELIKGLRIAHDHLRSYLANFDQEGEREKFVNLLDGHDEEEERNVYPHVVLETLGSQGGELLEEINGVLSAG